MDWFTALALGFGLEARRQKKEQQKQAETISTYRSEIFQAMFALDSLLSDLSFSNILAMEQKDLTDLEELAPLFPIAEILSMQGYISPEQRLFLQDYINFKSPRFNLGQFTKAAIGREGVYPQWHALTGLDSTYCGQIWHTLIELIYRQRAPEVMQQAVDLLGKILYLFWFFACTDMEPAQIRYKKIISNLNIHAERDQKDPYLHAVMLLQIELAKKYGGTESDFIPCLDSDSSYNMDGRVGFDFSVYRKDDSSFIHFYAVRKRDTPGEPDLIWELPAGKGAPSIFFSE